jgi:hypothetical protein
MSMNTPSMYVLIVMSTTLPCTHQIVLLFTQLLANLHHPLCLGQKQLRQCNMHGSIELLGDQSTCASYMLFLESENDVLNQCNNYHIPLAIH